MKLKNIVLLFIFWGTYVHAEILEIKVKVGGMVCTACVSVIKQAILSKVPEVSNIENINLETGIVQIKLKKNNKLTINQIQKKFDAAFKKSTYKLQSVDMLIAKGSVKKDSQGYFFIISVSKQRINIPPSLYEIAKTLLNKSAILSGQIQKIDDVISITDDDKVNITMAK